MIAESRQEHQQAPESPAGREVSPSLPGASEGTSKQRVGDDEAEPIRVWIPRDGSDGVFHDDSDCWSIYEPYDCGNDGGGAGRHWHGTSRDPKPCSELRRVVFPSARGIAKVALGRLQCDACGIRFAE